MTRATVKAAMSPKVRERLIGAGFEPMFVPQGQQQTYGEMEPAARGAINHRAAAFRLLAHRLGDAPPVVGSPSPGAG